MSVVEFSLSWDSFGEYLNKLPNSIHRTGTGIDEGGVKSLKNYLPPTVHETIHVPNHIWNLNSNAKIQIRFGMQLYKQQKS